MQPVICKLVRNKHQICSQQIARCVLYEKKLNKQIRYYYILTKKAYHIFNKNTKKRRYICTNIFHLNDATTVTSSARGYRRGKYYGDYYSMEIIILRGLLYIYLEFRGVQDCALS